MPTNIGQMCAAMSKRVERAKTSITRKEALQDQLRRQIASLKAAAQPDAERIAELERIVDELEEQLMEDRAQLSETEEDFEFLCGAH